MTNYLNEIFIRCSSQTMCGIKPSNLFTVSESLFSERDYLLWCQLMKEQGLSVTSFEISSKKIMIFIFDFVWVRKILGDSFVSAYLSGKGYSNVNDTSKTLQELFYRLKAENGFPHEVGIFLGYPVEDVINFEQQQGKRCQYCGYWKSYCNPEQAKKCCQLYKQCSQLCKQWFLEGYSVPQIIKKYKEMAFEAA